MAIEWRDKLSVGDAGIDADHRILIKIINEFEANAAQNLDREALSVTLKKLMNYTKEHFAREERLQSRMNYPYYDGHCLEHKRLLQEVEQYVRRYVLDSKAEIDAGVKSNMVHFLRDWLINHIIEQDLKMRPFFKKP